MRRRREEILANPLEAVEDAMFFSVIGHVWQDACEAHELEERQGFPEFVKLIVGADLIIKESQGGYSSGLFSVRYLDLREEPLVTNILQ